MAVVTVAVATAAVTAVVTVVVTAASVVTTASAANPGCETLRKALLLAGSVFLCIFARINFD